MEATAVAPAIISPRHLEAHLERARHLARGLDLPHDVPNSGGLRLCWSMRLWRAVRIAGEQPGNEIVQKAVADLCDHAETLRKDANDAYATYKQLCAQVGATPEPLSTPPCTCTGHQVLAAEAELQQAMWDLLLPDRGDDLPTFAKLSKEKRMDELNPKLTRLYNAQIRYLAACKAFGETPKWATVWNLHLEDI
jgi:hypothetical protein